MPYSFTDLFVHDSINYQVSFFFARCIPSSCYAYKRNFIITLNVLYEDQLIYHFLNRFWVGLLILLAIAYNVKGRNSFMVYHSCIFIINIFLMNFIYYLPWPIDFTTLIPLYTFAKRIRTDVKNRLWVCLLSNVLIDFFIF